MTTTHNSNFKPNTYEVTACDQVYYYALHSDRKDKIIFPSQVLNILEYVLFRKMKDGFRVDSAEALIQNFPWEVKRLKNRVAEDWANYESFASATNVLLYEYYKSAVDMLEHKE